MDINKDSDFYDFLENACQKHHQDCVFYVFQDDKGKFTHSSTQPEELFPLGVFCLDTRDIANQVHKLHPEDIGDFTIENSFFNQEIKDLAVYALNFLVFPYVENMDKINDTIAEHIFNTWLLRKKGLHPFSWK